MSIQIAWKINRSNKIVKTIGVAKTKREEELLILLAKTEIEQLQGMGRDPAYTSSISGHLSIYDLSASLKER